MEELTGIRGRRHRHLLGDVKERRSYGNLKDEELARDRWRTLIEEAIYMSYNTLRDCVVVVVVGGGGGGVVVVGVGVVIVVVCVVGVVVVLLFLLLSSSSSLICSGNFLRF